MMDWMQSLRRRAEGVPEFLYIVPGKARHPGIYPHFQGGVDGPQMHDLATLKKNW